MTEAEWLTCSHPGTLIQGRRGWRRTTRKLRLLACACYRRIWRALSNSNRFAIEVAERHADGKATNDELCAAQPARPLNGHFGGPKSDYLDCGVHYAAAPNRKFRSWAPTALFFAASAVAENGSKREAEVLAHCNLAREVFGNPFRPFLSITPSVLHWNGGIVKRLAEAAYDQRKMPVGTLYVTRLAVLADALEDAGCTDTDILAHLREPGPHVRGCFVLDLLLGKE